MSERPSAEQLAEIRRIYESFGNVEIIAVFRELDAVTRERDQAIERAERCEAYYNALTTDMTERPSAGRFMARVNRELFGEDEYVTLKLHGPTLRRALAPIFAELDAVTHEKDGLFDSLTLVNQQLLDVTRERDEARKEWDDEASDHAGALCELTEAQHAIVLLADQLERHSVPFVPEAEAQTAKARRDQEQMRRLDEIGKRAAAEAFRARKGQS